MVRCPVCGKDISFAELLTHLAECLDIAPGSRFLVGPLVVNFEAAAQGPPMRLADGIDFDQRRFLLWVSGKTHQLTALEARLLSYLVTNRHVVLSRDMILDAVWGTEVAVLDREVDCYIYRLRRLLKEHPRGKKMIVTVRDGGYRFEPSGPFEKNPCTFHRPSNQTPQNGR